MKIPELLAPAGSWESLSAAVKAGADSVYFGIKELNMRETAKNFNLDDLEKITGFCRKNKVKAYLTLNTIIYENEIDSVKKILVAAKNAKIDAVICWDFAVIEECNNLKIPFHISTQASVSNSESAKFFKNLGAQRIVLARECSLAQIKEIKKRANIEIETFIHGAMCVSISGRCFTSQFLYNRSANRGDCIQPCRRSYIVKDLEENKTLKLDNNYVMSAKDLCMIKSIDKLIEAGIDAFKIEGRTKSADYVKIVVEKYRQALDSYKQAKLTKELKDKLHQELKNVYHRGFSQGFYFGKPINEFAEQYGGIQKQVKVYAGIVVNFYKEISVAEIKLEGSDIKKGDKITVIGPTTGCVIQVVQSMEKDPGKKIKKAKKGTNIGIKMENLVRENDKVYVIKVNKAVVH
ncbi:U32 family peptidase [Candidatus Woesearchaeota archaeon]|nr:U32 family peptidase [Candidatus Woesearchaeota archaeon]